MVVADELENFDPAQIVKQGERRQLHVDKQVLKYLKFRDNCEFDKLINHTQIIKSRC